jgi:hypothetical protein
MPVPFQRKLIQGEEQSRWEGVKLNSSDSLPPDVQEWIDNTAKQLRETLAIPEVRAQILDLFCGERRIRGDDASD